MPYLDQPLNLGITLFSVMTLHSSFQKRLFSYLFRIAIALTLIIWILRGLSFLAFLPGIVLWILLCCSIGLGILAQMSR
jgi:hypothetical protein